MPQWVYASHLKDPEQKQIDRVEFVCALAECLLTRKPMVFVDETSAHLWQKKRCFWTPVEDRIKLPLSSSRGFSRTVIGGVSLVTDIPFTWTLAESTSTDEFLRYLTYLRTKMKAEIAEDEEVVLVLDNHSAHTNPTSMLGMAARHFKPMFIPACSSWLNSVEKAWAVMKHHFNCVLAEQRLTDLSTSKYHLEPLLRIALEHCEERITGSLYHACVSSMIKELEVYIAD